MSDMDYMVVDANYLCYRAFYSTGELSFNDISTGIVFGFFKAITSISSHLNLNRIIFCFDCGAPVRSRDYPWYKSNRKSKSYHEVQVKKHISSQIKLIRNELLAEVGYKNIVYQAGYEADDCIAAVIQNEGNFVLVSADKDLYQLLSKRVTIYNPGSKSFITEDSFSREYGVTPSQWVDVKAIAGCASDGIKGIPGVGEKTAAKFLNGTLKASSKAFQSIIANNHVWNKNRHLVKIPYPGVKKPNIVRDSTSSKKWRLFCKRFGFRSLLDCYVGM